MITSWIKYLKRTKFTAPIAILGSPGLRSVGILTIDHLLSDLKPKPSLTAELYSSHFPLFYQTSPSYAPSPGFPGESGVTITENQVELPKVEFYHSSPPELIIARGYHANFYGQHEVAEAVLNFLQEVGVKKIIVIAGYALEGESICCAATHLSVLEEMRQYGIEKGYQGPFYGFSGLVFGLATLREMEGITLFGKTKPNPEYPEKPDPSAANIVLEKLYQMLKIDAAS